MIPRTGSILLLGKRLIRVHDALLKQGQAVHWITLAPGMWRVQGQDWYMIPRDEQAIVQLFGEVPTVIIEVNRLQRCWCSQPDHGCDSDESLPWSGLRLLSNLHRLQGSRQQEMVWVSGYEEEDHQRYLVQMYGDSGMGYGVNEVTTPWALADKINAGYLIADH